MASKAESTVEKSLKNSSELSKTQIFQKNDSELGTQLRRSGSLRIPKSSNAGNRLQVSSCDGKASSSMAWTLDKSDGTPARPARHSAPAIDAPAPEYLARNLLQLGCPVVSMPTPRGGVGSEPPQSSDSDEYSTSHGHQQQQLGHGHGQGQADALNVPKVHVSGPSNSDESSSIINGKTASFLVLVSWAKHKESIGVVFAEI